MRWESPGFFFLFIPLIFLFLKSMLQSKESRGTLKLSTTSAVLKNSGTTLRQRLAFLPDFLKFIAAGLVIIALARPQQANSKVNRDVEGIDIMVAMDVSDSMNIEDMSPDSRIDTAKSVIRSFIKARTSDRIGLVIFAGESYTRCPLTLDYSVLLESLGSVTTENIKDGTAIGVGLSNAVARLKDSNAKSRVIILLTDGENNTGTIDPATATDITKGYGIKVYTIGIGKDGDAMLPRYETDLHGRRIKTYQPIHSSVNFSLLDTIASETGGKSFRATDGSALKQVFGTIDRLEKTKIKTHQYVKYNEQFMFWLVLAFVFYSLQLLLSKTVLRRGP